MRDLAKKLARATGSKAGAMELALAAFVEYIGNQVEDGKAVSVPGMGKFSVSERHRAGDVNRSLRFEAATILKNRVKKKTLKGLNHAVQKTK